MKNLKEIIIDILEDNQYWQPKMIIEEGEPFFWRLSKDWIREKTQGIIKTLKDKICSDCSNRLFPREDD